LPADPKPPERRRDRELLTQLHREWTECAICGGTKYTMGRLSLHHVHRHPRDDVRGNLVMLCGHGTTCCHGLIEAHDPEACEALYGVLTRERPDTMEYLAGKLGGATAASEWLSRHLYAPS